MVGPPVASVWPPPAGSRSTLTLTRVSLVARSISAVLAIAVCPLGDDALHGAQERIVLVRMPGCDPQATRQARQVVLAPHHDTAVQQRSVNGRRVTDAEQHEVGLAGEHLDAWQEREGRSQPAPRVLSDTD